MTDLRTFFNTHRPKSSPGHVELAAEHTRAAPGEVALDLCCGSGRLTALAAARGLHAVGVDISTQFIGTEGAGQAAFVVGNMMNVPFRSGCAGVVYCVDSLQYADDPEGALAEMARLLKPGGQLIFSTQNTYNLAGIKKAVMERLTGRTWSPWLAHPVERAVTYPWLMRALARQGFEVEIVRGRQHIIPWISLLPEPVRRWTPWPGKSWRSLQGIAQRIRLPAWYEQSVAGHFGMILFVCARKRD